MNLKIINFEERSGEISAGFVLNGFIVYGAIVGIQDINAERKDKIQALYQVVKKSLDYEMQLIENGKTPSIEWIEEDEKKKGNVKSIEYFEPELPKASKIEMQGSTAIDSPTAFYSATIYDQYNVEINGNVTWEIIGNGANIENGILSVVDFTNREIQVKAKYQEIEEVLNVSIFERTPTKEEILDNYILDLEFRLAIIEMGGM